MGCCTTLVGKFFEPAENKLKAVFSAGPDRIGLAGLAGWQLMPRPELWS